MAKKFVRVGDPVKPNPAHVEIYKKKFAEYKRLRGYMLDSLGKK